MQQLQQQQKKKVARRNYLFAVKLSSITAGKCVKLKKENILGARQQTAATS